MPASRSARVELVGQVRDVTPRHPRAGDAVDGDDLGGQHRLPWQRRALARGRLKADPPRPVLSAGRPAVG